MAINKVIGANSTTSSGAEVVLGVGLVAQVDEVELIVSVAVGSP